MSDEMNIVFRKNEWDEAFKNAEIMINFLMHGCSHPGIAYLALRISSVTLKDTFKIEIKEEETEIDSLIRKVVNTTITKRKEWELN
jgi:hypothetical protein